MNLNTGGMVDLGIPLITIYAFTGAGTLFNLLVDGLGYSFGRTDRTGGSVRFGCIRMQGG